MTNVDALAAAFARAAGICECIGGGCPSLSHRPDINRCFAALASLNTTYFYTVRRFADRTDPDNIMAICAACAESPRRNVERVFAPSDAVAVAGEAFDEQSP